MSAAALPTAQTAARTTRLFASQRGTESQRTNRPSPRTTSTLKSERSSAQHPLPGGGLRAREGKSQATPQPAIRVHRITENGRRGAEATGKKSIGAGGPVVGSPA